MALESYVKITEVLKDAPALSAVATPFLVSGAIKARYGDFKVNYFNSRRDFLDKYTVDGKLSNKCDISLINAYEVLGSAPILVVRASNGPSIGATVINCTPVDANLVLAEGSLTDESLWGLVFDDFIKQDDIKISVGCSKSNSYPGALNLQVQYLYDSGLYSFNPGVITPGTGYKEGEIVNLGAEAKARVLTVDADGGILTLKYLSKTISTSETSLEITGGSGADASVAVVSTKLPADVVKGYELVMALSEDIYDNKGKSLFYKNIWDDKYPFHIEIGSGSPESVTIPNPYVVDDPTQPEVLTYLNYSPTEDTTIELVGTVDKNGNGKGSDVQDTEVDGTIAASGNHWSALELYEDRQIPMFSDFGVAGTGSYLKSLANRFNGMYCISVPRSKESVNGVSAWDELDLGNSRRYAATPFAQTTHLGFLAYIAPSTQYINTLVSNTLRGSEFEAIAGKTNGIAAYHKLTKYYNKSDRESLLDAKVNTITYRDVDGYATFNDDLTGLVQNNPFKEEFNRRLGIRIAQDLDTIMQQFKFKLNTPSLRDTITSTLNTYFETSSFKPKLADFQVICNDDNNPPSLQAQNKLAITVNIAFYYTAKYIEILNNIYSVGQSFNS